MQFIRTISVVFSIFIGFVITVGVTACNSPSASKPKAYVPLEEIGLEISTSTGGILSLKSLDLKVPTFFNVGQLDSTSFTILLSKSVEIGQKVPYTPIGMYSLEIDSSNYAFIIGNPIDESLQLFSAESYNTFSLEQIQIKALIDSWFKTNCKDLNCRNLSWQNDLKALRKLEQFQN